ncbi:MAG: hypothetical protein L3J35_05640 [Bacteroidales bacterium]|nr:hypothetical protein [Bacteroidales bacterium]
MDYIQIIGYIASIIIAVSMTMNSIVKFRWINLAGASFFLTYGILFNAIPIVVLNTFIISVDIFYLVRIYNKKELFTTIEIRSVNKYLLEFLKFHKKEIDKFFPGFTYKPELNTISFFILRNMAVAGIFLAHKIDKKTLKVGLDFVVPAYRDYKNAKFVYGRLRNNFIEDGIEQIIVFPQSYNHVKYLKKIGFVRQEDGNYIKILEKNN